MGNRRPRPSVVFVFGENVNDSKAICALVEHLRPELRGRLKAKPRPISLARGAGTEARLRWSAEVAEVIATAVRAGQPVCATLVHQDGDEVDLTGEGEEALNALHEGAIQFVPVVPVVTIESWWFHFADATESVSPKWRGALPRGNAQSDSLPHPKSDLKRLTRDKGREYAESDSIKIAENVNKFPGCVGQSPSYDRFAQRVAGLMV